jgi:hypothetical protein
VKVSKLLHMLEHITLKFPWHLIFEGPVAFIRQDFNTHTKSPSRTDTACSNTDSAGTVYVPLA